jgi:hypothetical protein
VVDLDIDRSFVRGIAGLAVVMVMVYVGAASLQRRSAAWPLLLLGMPVLFLPDKATTPAIAVLVAVTAAFVAYGSIRQRRHRPPDLPLQTLAALAVVALCLTALAADRPTVGAVLLAAALLGHAAWDYYHHWQAKVVTRSYAEFCGVVDVVIAIGILAGV